MGCVHGLRVVSSTRVSSDPTGIGVGVGGERERGEKEGIEGEAWEREKEGGERNL